MTEPITPTHLFAVCGAVPCGPFEWGEKVLEQGSGVYIITVPPDPLLGRHVVYIGRAKRLDRRLRQFYRHKYGASAPHRGGQEILNLEGPMSVCWAKIEDYANAEHRMLQWFHDKTGAWPYGNKVKSTRMSSALLAILSTEIRNDLL
jgi:hypothetical protein